MLIWHRQNIASALYHFSMPATRATTSVEVGDQSFSFRTRVLEDLPAAAAFLAYLLRDRGVAAHTAAHYVKLVAKLRRQGKLDQPELIAHVTERTAANAYMRWVVEAHTARLAPVRRLFTNERERLKFLRVHSLVPPYGDKRIPIVQLPQATEIPADVLASKPDPDNPTSLVPALPASPPRWEENAVVMVPAPNVWTLHIPHGPVEPHTDPCETCTAHILSDRQLSVLGDAFFAAWGHRDINALSPDEYLFGSPPIDNEVSRPLAKTERVVALIGDQAITTRDALSRAVHAQTSHDVNEFLARLRDGSVAGVYISRETAGERLGDVLGAIWNAWGERP